MNSPLRVTATVLALTLGLAGGVSAQSTWNLVSGSDCTQNSANSGNFGNSWACTGVGTAGTSASASAWSNDRGTNGSAQAGSGWANAYMSPQNGSGFGTASRTEGLSPGAPDHSVDSIAPGTYDFVMVQFTAAVILDQFRIGWGAADSDITVMRWNGGGIPTGGTGTVTTGGNATLNNTISASGWQLVNSFSDVCRDGTGGGGVLVTNNGCNATNSTRSTGATVGSSYWLISAFNTTMDNTGNGWTTGNDGFKLNWLRTTAYTCPNGGTSGPGGACGGGGSGGGGVPEPGSLALLAIAGLSAAGARRRWSKRA